MSVTSNIKKMLFLLLGVAAGAGLLILLVAAINKKNHKNCTGTAITINGKGEALFLSRQGVLAIIAPDKTVPLKGKPLASFNLKKMEGDLEQNQWVSDAQLFFDNNGILQVAVNERVPVARIFTVNGSSFFIDSTGTRLPLSAKATIKLPVFSNFPADKAKLYGADSVLMQQIRKMSPFILASPFWMAQIGQVDITPGRTFEMIPVIGKHIIAFGNGDDYEQKFHRLLLFYQQVGAKVGLDKYIVINVAFNKQVVATKRGTTGKIDSLQALKNIGKMIEAARQVLYDTVSTKVDNKIAANALAMPTLTTLKGNQQTAVVKDSVNQFPASIHPALLKSPAIKPEALQTKQSGKARLPKAILRKASG